MLWRQKVFVLWLAALLVHCGSDSYIILQIDDNDKTPLAIPQNVNTLTVSIKEVESLSEVGAESFVLSEEKQFPMEILLQPSTTTSKVLQVAVLGFLNTKLVARSNFQIPNWEDGKINRTKPVILENVP